MPEPRAGDADRRWAAEQAPRLLAEARAEALQDARERLRGRLVDALMSAAVAGAPAAPARAAEEPPAPTLAEALGVWVYGVVHGDAPDPPRRSGVDAHHDVELIRHAGLAAVASAVPLDEFREDALEESLEDLQRLEALARAHERVLDDMLALGPVVPLRICTIYASADRVREMLERERGTLTDALHRLSGTAEWGVKAYLGGSDEPGEAEGPEEPAAEAAPASGIDYLDRKRDERNAADAARRAADTTVEQIHRRLSGHSVDAVLLNPVRDPGLSGHAPEMLLNAAYLVPKARTDDFRALVSAIARRHAQDGLVLELTGPWPAYHFAGAAAAG